jgi:RNA polymerase sigma-70 factor (ECF subfamily)
MTDDDERLFMAVYNRHFRAVLGYALARVGPEQAKDVAAETFLIAWRRLAEIPAEPAGWLFGIARKVIAGQLRKDGRQGALRVRLALAGTGQGGPANPADQAAERDAARLALARLGEQDQEVLMMAAWDGFAPDVAAEVLGISKAAYRTRLHRARQRLSAELAELAEQDARKPRPSGARQRYAATVPAPVPQMRKAR